MRILHVISHTHWDREWYLTFQQFRLKLVELVDDLLELLEHDPQFLHFMLDGQTIVLEDYLLVRPEKEAILRKHIQSGRILIGPWHILPDMFLVAGESHIRNLLEGDRTSKKFGSKMMIGYMPDSFGHIAQMPQILRGFGIENACLWRGLDEEPAEFWWQSPDGSRVLMANLRESYSNGASLPGGKSAQEDVNRMQRFTAAIAQLGEQLAAHSAAQDHLIMLGTDHMPPPPSTSENIAYADETLGNMRVVHSTLEEYIAAVRRTSGINLPVVTGELRASRRIQLLPGVLSTRMSIKQRNAACENLLTRWVEPFSTFAELYARPTHLRQPGGIIRQAWRLLMENHPHDSICGCSIDQVAQEMMTRFDQVDQIGDELTRQSLQALAQNIETGSGIKDASAAIVVFNPLSYKHTGPVVVDVQLPEGADSFDIIDGNGETIPHDTSGVGTTELINIRMSPAEFRSSLASVNEGHIIGWGMRAFRSRREGDTMHLDVTLHQGEPDLAVWHTAKATAGNLLEDSTIHNIHVRARSAEAVKTTFSSPDVPGLGWRVFGIRPITKESTPVNLPWFARALLPLSGLAAKSPAAQTLLERLANRAQDAGKQIENEFFSVKVEPSGTLSVLDKHGGQVFRGLNCFIDEGDAGDEYNYSQPLFDSSHTARLKSVTTRRGAASQTLSIQLSLKIPAAINPDRKFRSKEMVEIVITSVATLHAGVPRIDIHTTLENHARDHRLRVHFPTPFQVDSFLTDNHFDLQERQIALPVFDRETWAEDPRPEAPQRAFCQVVDPSGSGGLTLANRGLPEVEVIKGGSGAEIALTLLRCVGWLSRDDLLTRRGHAGPAIQTPGAQMPGKHAFDYAILPHRQAGAAAARAQAFAFENGLRAVFIENKPGGNTDLPGAGSFVSISPERLAGYFCLSAVKQAEDGSGWLIRGYNSSNEHLEVRLQPLKPIKQARLANLAEQKMELLAVDKKDGSINVMVKPHEIITVWMGD